MAATPLWATDLLAEVGAGEGFSPESITLVWRRRRGDSYSSGRAWTETRRIVVTAGSDRVEARLTLLHEIAHIISPAAEHHGREFYRTAWRLFLTYGRTSNKRVIAFEGWYRAASLDVAIELGIRGAKAAKAGRPKRHRHRYVIDGFNGVASYRACACGAVIFGSRIGAAAHSGR